MNIKLGWNQNVNQEIYRTIKERILFLDYPPGMMLNEKVLAEEFGVSRTPLREVLNRLDWEKLVKILPRAGTMVSQIEFEKMVNAYQVRLEMEGLVWRLACEHLTAEHLEKIDGIRRECRQLLEQKDRKGLMKIDFKLREVLHDAANNPILSELSDYLYNITIRLWYSIFDRGDWREEIMAYLDETDQTYEALKTRDPGKACELRRSWLTRHIERIKGKF